MSLDQGTAASVSDCVFTGNTTQLSGTVRNLGSSMFPTVSTFSDCTFTGNTAYQGGGILNDISATLNADHCTFLRNTATSAGGAVYSWQSRINLTNSRFLGNAAGPLVGSGVSDGGAVLTLSSSPAHRPFIVNCEFVGNRAARGGAILDLGITGSIVYNSTFVNNAASSSGGAVDARDGSTIPTKLANGILWGNTAPTGAQVGAPATPPSVSYCDVQGGFAPGAGNINADPVFVRDPSSGVDGAWGTGDDDYGDLRLQIQSPCIDTGNNAEVAANYLTDIAGRKRVFNFPGNHDPGAIVDMGANELGLTLGLLRLVPAESLALPAGGFTFVVEQLVLGAGARLDLADDAMVLENTTLAAVQAQITAGFNGGDWLGAGIASSAAAADPNARTAIGYADNAEFGLEEFAGVGGLTGDEILLKYTYYGDADLSGVVDLDDFGLFLTGYQNPSLPRTWIYGDFDYTAATDLDDFGLFLYGYQNQGGPL
jgi:predicted outer membrane repeat protein